MTKEAIMRLKTISLLLIVFLVLLYQPLILNGKGVSEDDRCESRIIFSFPTVSAGMPVYVINSDNNGLREVISADSRNDAEVSYLAWSPDGQQIAFIKFTNSDGAQLYILSTNEANLPRSTENKKFDYILFQWSPDSKQILGFASEDKNPSNLRLHVINIETMELTEINVPDGYEVTGGAVWSPDGKKIAFGAHLTNDLLNKGDIYVLSVENLLESNQSFLENLTDIRGEDTAPRWSSMGDRILFISNRDGDYDVYVMDEDGSNLRNLTSDDQDEFAPKWSPDNQLIAYVAVNENRETDLYVVDVNRSEEPRKIFTNANAYDWSPDGAEIVVTEGSIIGSMYIVNVESGEVRGLALSSIIDIYSPSTVDWSACIP